MKYRFNIRMQDSKEYYLIEERRKFLWMITFWVVTTVGQDYEKVKELYHSQYEPLNK